MAAWEGAGRAVASRRGGRGEGAEAPTASRVAAGGVGETAAVVRVRGWVPPATQSPPPPAIKGRPGAAAGQAEVAGGGRWRDQAAGDDGWEEPAAGA